MSRGELTELLERVKKAEGPDRELGEAVVRALGFHAWAGRMRYRDADGIRWWDFGSSEVTASVDAALALVERVLPGWKYRLDQYPDRVECNLGQWRQGFGLYGDDFDGTALTAPLAILAALLTALISQSSDGGEGGGGGE